MGVNGASGQAIQSAGFPEARASVALNAPIGTTGRMAAAAVDATANRDEAVVSVNGAARVRVRRGAALVLIDPRGGIEAYPVEGARDLRVPFDMTIFPLFRVAGTVSCVDVGNAGWKDVSTILARADGAADRQLPAVPDLGDVLPVADEAAATDGHGGQRQWRSAHDRHDVPDWTTPPIASG